MADRSLIQKIAKEIRVLTAADTPDFEQHLQRWSDIDRKTPAAVLLPRAEDECRKAVSIL